MKKIELNSSQKANINKNSILNSGIIKIIKYFILSFIGIFILCFLGNLFNNLGILLDAIVCKEFNLINIENIFNCLFFIIFIFYFFKFINKTLKNLSYNYIAYDATCIKKREIKTDSIPIYVITYKDLNEKDTNCNTKKEFFDKIEEGMSFILIDRVFLKECFTYDELNIFVEQSEISYIEKMSGTNPINHNIHEIFKNAETYSKNKKSSDKSVNSYIKINNHKFHEKYDDYYIQNYSKSSDCTNPEFSTKSNLFNKRKKEH